MKYILFIIITFELDMNFMGEVPGHSASKYNKGSLIGMGFRAFEHKSII